MSQNGFRINKVNVKVFNLNMQDFTREMPNQLGWGLGHTWWSTLFISKFQTVLIWNI